MPKAAKPYEPTRTVGKNLLRLINGEKVLPWATRHKLGQTTINRILRNDLDPTTDTLEKIAAATGLQAWQLVAPGLAQPQEEASPFQAAIAAAIATRIREIFTETELPEVLKALDVYATLHPVGLNPVPGPVRFEFHRVPVQEVPAAVEGEESKWVVNQIKKKPKPPSRRAKV